MPSNCVYSLRAAADNFEDYFCCNWCNGDLDKCHSYYDCPISRLYVVPARLTMRLGSNVVEYSNEPWQNFCAHMAEKYLNYRLWRWEEVSTDNMAAMMYYYLDKFSNKRDMAELDEIYDGQEYVEKMYSLL